MNKKEVQIMPICSLKTMKDIIKTTENQGYSDHELLGITSNGNIAVSSDYSDKSIDKCSNSCKNCTCSDSEEINNSFKDYDKSAACNPYRRGLLYISDLELNDKYEKEPIVKDIIDECRFYNTTVCDNLLTAIDDINKKKKEIINNTINQICDLDMTIAKGVIDTVLEHELRLGIANSIDMCYIVNKVENNKNN